MELELSEIIIDEQIDLGSLELDVLKIQPTLIKKEIVDNGNYSASDDNVDGYSEIDVNVNMPKIQENITKQYKQNGKYIVVADENYDVIKKVEVDVDVPMPKIGTKKITENGTYKAIDDGLDGYSSVDVNVGGIKITDAYYLFYNGARLNSINELIGALSPDTTNFYSMFYGCGLLTAIPQFNTSKGTNFNSMLYRCRSLTTIPQLDTSEGTNFSYMFYGCSSLKIIPLLNFSKGISVSYMFNDCRSLTDFGGLENLGQAYSTTQSANYSDYKLNLSSCTALTEQSLINVLNNLYDIATKGCKAQQVVLGSTNLAKLVSEEGQQALSNSQAKGWSIS